MDSYPFYNILTLNDSIVDAVNLPRQIRTGEIGAFIYAGTSVLSAVFREESANQAVLICSAKI